MFLNSFRANVSTISFDFDDDGTVQFDKQGGERFTESNLPETLRVFNRDFQLSYVEDHNNSGEPFRCHYEVANR